ncbi:MAG: hypothetical protein R2838_24725 [Caldilineaceae bacterium]
MAAVGLLPDEDGRRPRPASLFPRDRRRALFTQLAEDAGLDVQVDAAANLSAPGVWAGRRQDAAHGIHLERCAPRRPLRRRWA